MWLTLWRKPVFVNIYPILMFCSETNVQIQICLRIAPFKYGKKKNLLSFLVLISEIATFMSKKKSSL